MSGREALVERVRDAIHAARPKGVYSEAFGWDEAERMADAVLDALGLERVGIGWKQNGSHWFDGIECGWDDPEANTGMTWPVYRLSPKDGAK